jgi:hypothetical protein
MERQMNRQSKIVACCCFAMTGLATMGTIIIVLGIVGGPAKSNAASSPLQNLQAEIAKPMGLVELTPDGPKVVELFRTAKTIPDLVAASANAKTLLGKLSSVENALTGLHTVVSRQCTSQDYLEQPSLLQVAEKTQSFLTGLSEIDRRMTNSLAKLTVENGAAATAPYSVQTDLAGQLRYVLDDLRRMRLDAELKSQTIVKLVGMLPTIADATCHQGEIPALFDDNEKEPGDGTQRQSD